ncbi:MAG TPA: ABC transporter ATP-binding protein [Burkholderiales bacterium]|jgi:ABC-type polysaccharide/polyol phosphate transport system ATPase subunit
MASVILDGVGVDFPVYTPRSRSLRQQLTQSLGGRLSADARVVTVRALDDISLALADGDRVGIVGANGAGKTTLLRVIAGVYPPIAGRVAISGKVAAYTDLTLGMDMESSGWENIVYRSIYLGLGFRQARVLAPSIGEFTELGSYLDLPVRTYSQGMLLRLAFAVATAIHPDILVMDEMIGVGDPHFADRAAERVKQLMYNSRILVIASHAQEILRAYCNKILWLEQGRLRGFGPIEETLAQYAASRSASIS